MKRNYFEIEIRKMRHEDLPAVMRIEEEVFSVPWSPDSFESALSQPSAIWILALADGEAIGYCGLLQSFEDADIVNVAVLPFFRRRGIAREMLLKLMAQGRRQGVERFLLEVRESNTAAIRLYEGLGFYPIAVRKRYYEYPLEDALVMQTDPGSREEQTGSVGGR